MHREHLLGRQGSKCGVQAPSKELGYMLGWVSSAPYSAVVIRELEIRMLRYSSTTHRVLPLP